MHRWFTRTQTVTHISSNSTVHYVSADTRSVPDINITKTVPNHFAQNRLKWWLQSRISSLHLALRHLTWSRGRVNQRRVLALVIKSLHWPRSLKTAFSKVWKLELFF